jgi:hypothetical protein
MKYLITILLTLFSLSIVKAQTDESIINDLFFNLFDPLSFNLSDNIKDTLLISSTIYKTYFDYDSAAFENETGFKVPKKIISDWKKNLAPDNFISFWNERELNKIDTIFTVNDTVVLKKPFVKCLSQTEEKSLFEKAKIRQRVYSISKILFDDSRENAIFELLYTPWPGDVSGGKIFIKKVFGVWIIIARFDYSMT